MWIVWVIAYFIVGNDFLLPSFWETFKAMGRYLIDAGFWRNFADTLLRTLWAFLVSLVLGAGLALLASAFKGVRGFLAPIISVLRTVPTMAVILLLLVWTSHATAPVVVSVLVLLPAFFSATLASIDEVTQEYGELVRAFHVDRKRRIFKMYLPLAAPAVLGQAGSVLSMGLKITVSGEVLAQTFHSIGYSMQEARMLPDMPALVALTLLCVLLGFLLEGGCFLLKKLIVRWRK